MKSTNGKVLSCHISCLCLMYAEYNLNIKNRTRQENTVADGLSRNPLECIELVKEVNFCAFSSMVLRSREQELKKDLEFGGLYHYLDDPDVISSLNAARFEKLSQLFKFVEDLPFLPFYSKSVIHEVNLEFLSPIIFVRLFSIECHAKLQQGI